jgi:iron complex transport system substrate-binding protein
VFGGTAHAVDDGGAMVIEQPPIFECPWLALVGITNYYFAKSIASIAYRIPLKLCRKSGAATSAQTIEAINVHYMHNIGVRNSTLLCLITLLFAACQKDAPATLVKEHWRVITIAPSTAANMQALGLSSAMVGVSEWCPVGTFQGLSRVGSLGAPSLERIAELNPNIVIVQGRQDVLEKYCQQNGVFFKSFTTDSLESWRQEINWLGDAFDCQDRAASLVKNFDEQLTKLNPNHLSKPCLLVASRKNFDVADLLVAARQSFLNELLVAAGGSNVVADDTDYVYLQEELLPELNPHIIFELHESEAATRSLTIWQKSFEDITAVGDNQVYSIFNPQALMPGPNMIETARIMSEIIQLQKPVQ